MASIQHTLQEQPLQRHNVPCSVRILPGHKHFPESHGPGIPDEVSCAMNDAMVRSSADAVSGLEVLGLIP